VIDTIITGLIVLAATVYASRSLIRTLSGSGQDCGCAGACKTCHSTCSQLVAKNRKALPRNR